MPDATAPPVDPDQSERPSLRFLFVGWAAWVIAAGTMRSASTVTITKNTA